MNITTRTKRNIKDWFFPFYLILVLLEIYVGAHLGFMAAVFMDALMMVTVPLGMFAAIIVSMAIYPDCAEIVYELCDEDESLTLNKRIS